ncbi:MAG: hypothetical protein QM528_07170 [Phycisphaerales bacterium]|nr:hypothetical protein [Phycisphaerales bacterium]
MQHPLFKNSTLKVLITILSSLFLISCQTNNVEKTDDFKPLFQSAHVSGCFALYDNQRNIFTIDNLYRYRDTLYSPGETFNIVLALIATETGHWLNTTEVIKSPQNKSTTLFNDFQQPPPLFFQSLAQQIGLSPIKYWVDSLRYGNKNIGDTLQLFWLNQSLKITCDEQLGLIKELYFSQLPFHKTTQDLVAKLLVKEQHSNYTLAYQESYTLLPNGHYLGWLLGWIEKDKQPVFFIINDETTDAQAPQEHINVSLLKQYLNQHHFLTPPDKL